MIQRLRFKMCLSSCSRLRGVVAHNRNTRQTKIALLVTQEAKTGSVSQSPLRAGQVKTFPCVPLLNVYCPSLKSRPVTLAGLLHIQYPKQSSSLWHAFLATMSNKPPYSTRPPQQSLARRYQQFYENGSPTVYTEEILGALYTRRFLAFHTVKII